MALMAWPELYPSAGVPLTLMAVNMLKRLMLSGPYILFRVTNWEIGAISFPLRTMTWFNVSGLTRKLASDWIITR